MLNRVSLRQMEYFVATVKYGSIASASAQIHISSPSISAAIAHIENELNVQLFVRHPSKGLGLSDARGEARHGTAPIATTDQIHDDIVDADLERHQVGLVVVGVENPTKHELLLVAHAIGPGGLHASTTQSRQEHPGQNGDDRDHHQEFDQGKTGTTARLKTSLHWVL